MWSPIYAAIEGTKQTSRNVLNLKDPFYRCSDYSQSGYNPAENNNNNKNMDQVDEMDILEDENLKAGP